MKLARVREFTWVEGLSLLLAMIGVQLSSELFAMWGMLFYSPPEGTGRTIYVTIGAAGLIFAVGRIFDTITDPLIGAWSDKTKTQGSWLRLIPISGRRRPFIFWGAVLMTFTAIVFWYPPFKGTAVINVVYGTAIMCLHWLFFTICVVPLNSLGPEIARSRQGRVKVGQFIAIGMILGLAIAYIIPPILIKKLDPEWRPRRGVQRAAAAEQTEQTPPAAEDAGESAESAELETFSPKGYQRTAAVFALISLGVLLLPVIFVRERHQTDVARPPTPPFAEMFEALRNTVFLRYLAAFIVFQVGYMAAQRVLGHWAIVGLGGEEDLVAVLMGPFILSCLATAFVIMPVMSKFLPTKWLWFISFAMIATGLPWMYPISRMTYDTAILPEALNASWMGLLGTESVLMANKVFLSVVLFMYVGVGQGIQYVVMVALIGEIIDLDEESSGERREAVYNGISGVAYKLGYTFSILFASGLMRWFGNTVDRPYGVLLVGPAAGVFGLLGMLVVWFYPVLHVTPERAVDLLDDTQD